MRIAAGADNALAGVRTNKRNVFHERVDVFENRVVDTLKYVFSYGGFDKVRIVDMSVAVRRVRKNLALDGKLRDNVVKLLIRHNLSFFDPGGNLSRVL